MAVTKEEIIEAVENMTALELKDLVDALADKFGVDPNAAAAVAVAAPAAGGAAAEEEEKTEFDVVLESFGDNKIKVIKVVRELTSLGLKEAKELVDNAPKPVLEGANKEAADDAKAKLEEAGAVVTVK
ncbi:MAG: 50S ribosomal protein L7/L12 [Coriobacteriales bacterium]|jgi:large subunit ribosomal protein L7/L12|nr:50S ribosomal protein L7/L12 [Coriobacteriales bacterium]